MGNGEKQTRYLEERLINYTVRILKIVERLPNTRVSNRVRVRTAEKKQK
jgi:hypothetical protein